MIQSLSSHWHTLDASTFEPDYIDVPGNALRSYGSAIVFEDTEDRFAIVSDKRALRFIKYFAVFFFPSIVALEYFFLHGIEKWIAICLTPICGGLAFSIAYYLAHHEISSGPYIEFLPELGIVRLPRYNAEITLQEIECLQLITGGSKYRAADRQTDLNLITRNADGQRHRYFLLGSPRQKIALAIAERLRVPIEKVVLRFGGIRNVDSTTS